MIRSIFKKTKTTTKKDTTTMTTQPGTIVEHFSQLADLRDRIEEHKKQHDAHEDEYRTAIAAGDEATAMSALENKAEAERNIQMLSDLLEAKEGRLPEVKYRQHEAAILEQIKNAQDLAEREYQLAQQLIDGLQALEPLRQELQQVSAGAVGYIHSLGHQFSQYGEPVHSGIERKVDRLQWPGMINPRLHPISRDLEAFNINPNHSTRYPR